MRFIPQSAEGFYQHRCFIKHPGDSGQICGTVAGIETAFRYLKHAVGAADFHCKSFENVTHEVWARLILFNCCSAITALAVSRQPEQSGYIYEVNYTMAIKNTHTYLRQKETEAPIAIVAIIEKYTCPIRPERSFERRHRYQTPLKFGYRH